jgi:ATP-dependent DNA helicase PIF1
VSPSATGNVGRQLIVKNEADILLFFHPSPLLCAAGVLDLVLSGKSIFFTGNAGTGQPNRNTCFLFVALLPRLGSWNSRSCALYRSAGKTFLLKCIMDALPRDTTVATASTGVAACATGGMTLHAFAGVQVRVFHKRKPDNPSIISNP